MRKAFRILGWFIISLVVLLVIFLLFSVKGIDRTPYDQQGFYKKMLENIDGLDSISIPTSSHGFLAGYGKENITPPYPTSMAGSGPRKLKFEDVHDSIFVRTMVIDNGAVEVALVSLDLLIVPPSISTLLKEKLPVIGFNLSNTYLSATHTHSSIGNWGEHLAGRIYSGPFDDDLVQFVCDKIIQSILLAKKNKVPSVLKEGTIPVSGVLYNRLAHEAGTIDSLMRVIEVERSDGKKLLLTTFTGHPTCDKSSSKNISRDYPGVLVDQLEDQGYSFAMFMAGAVGSHGCRGPERGEPRINFVADNLFTAFNNYKDSLKNIEDSTLIMVRVPLELGQPQLRLTKNLCIRPWLFNSVFGTYPAYLTALRIGDVIMLGTPCDYSGELTAPVDAAAKRLGMQAMVTSFNGDYIGYITLDKHYDMDHYETRIMNWYGPGNGAYLSECLVKMVETVGSY